MAFLQITAIDEKYTLDGKSRFAASVEFSGYTSSSATYSVQMTLTSGIHTEKTPESKQYIEQPEGQMKVLTGSVQLVPSMGDWLELFPSASQIPVEVTVFVYQSENGSRFVAATATRTVLFKAGAAAGPILSDGWVTLSPYNADGAGSMFTPFAKSLSKVRAEMDASKVTAQYGATIEGIILTVDGGTYSAAGNQITSGFLNSYGKIPVVVKAYDSRGVATAFNTEIDVCEYSAPSLSDVRIFRSNSDFSENEEGTYLAIRATANYSPVNGENSYQMNARWAHMGEEYSAPVELTNAQPAIVGDGMILPNNSYSVMITLSDITGNAATVSRIIPTGFATFDALNGGNGFAFGRRAEKAECLDVAWDIHADGDISTDGSVTATGNVTASGDVHGAIIHGTGSDIREYIRIGGYIIKKAADGGMIFTKREE